MMTRILIIGFQRSGTTLLRRMVQNHPDVFILFHETWLLTGTEYSDESAWRAKLCRLAGESPRVWGEKIAYNKSKMEKHFGKPAILVYCDLWEEMFGEQSKIIHIVRHPIDCALSATKLKWAKSPRHVLDYYFNVVPKVINNSKNIFAFKYEDLIEKPVLWLTKIFDFCELYSDFNLCKNIADQKLINLESAGSSSIKKSRRLAYMNPGSEEEILLKKLRTYKVNPKLLTDLNKIGVCKYQWI